jgi:hypothetical protein
MTSKEKAHELFERFSEYGWISPTDSRITKGNVIRMISDFIDELLIVVEDCKRHSNDEGAWDIDRNNVEYWKEVKQEINNL